jgi:hypothetical protein
VLILPKNGLGYTLGNYLSTSPGHPVFKLPKIVFDSISLYAYHFRFCKATALLLNLEGFETTKLTLALATPVDKFSEDFALLLSS